MSIFSNRRPRGFSHRLIYSDERRERLREIEERARRELGMLPPREFRPDDLRGAFVRSTRHLRRRKEREASGHPGMRFGVAVFLIALLLYVMRYLLTGVWSF